MHDERLLTGGCHNHLDCGNFRNSCFSCPATRIPVRRKIRKIRRESEHLIQSKNIRVITPSIWLGKEVELSTLGGVKPFVVANPIRREFYSDPQTAQAQSKTHHQNLLFVAANPWVPLKGLSELISSLSDIEKSGDHLFTLSIVGKSEMNVKVPKFAKIIGELDGAELTKVILQCDFVVVPSKAENSPGIISEAQFLGKLVVATNVGGIPELVSDLETGVLQNKNETLSSLLNRALCLTNQDRELIRLKAQDLAINRLSNASLIKSTLEVYREVMRNAR
jgi:glycosyltransferase involved in cell wall biosynthesis